MSSDFRNYMWHDLERADHIALAAALTTIYMEGMGRSPRNPSWNEWNTYSVGYIPGKSSFITVHAFEGCQKSNNIFFLNTNRQDVRWKEGKSVKNVTPVPEHLQPFLEQLTRTVHNIEAKREVEQAKALVLKRKREEEAREEVRKYEANKEEIDAERERKRKRMEEAQKAQAKRELEDKLSCRKVEVKNIGRVMNWKASAAELSASPLDENPTRVQQMLESAKQDPQHDLCVACGETLRFCAQNGCSIIGCINCFEDELAMCSFCERVLCGEHGYDFNTCYTCDILVCKVCDGQTCMVCGEFICNDCNECRGCGISLNFEAGFEESLYESFYDRDYYEDDF